MSFHMRLFAGALSLVLIGSACSDLPTNPAGARIGSGAPLAQGGGTGGGTVTTAPSILPTTPPAPDVLLRESFGLANGQRPQGGKGVMRDVYTHTTLGGFWLEYLGTKDNQWITPQTGQTWKFCAASDNPYEMPSPLQTSGNGCVVSEWFDPPTSYPTALMAFAPPADGYELSMEGWPAPIPNGYIAIGFTSSGAVTSNLTTSGSLWLRMRDLGANMGPLSYELRTGGLTGTVLASGFAGYAGWNRMSIRVSPATSSVTLTIDGIAIGTYSASISQPRYVAFEGIGVLDNLVIRR